MQNYLISTLLAVTHYSVYVGHIGQILLLIKFSVLHTTFLALFLRRTVLCSPFPVPYL